MVQPKSTQSIEPEQILWTPSEEQRLIELKAKGLTYRKISEEMARSFYSVKKKYYDLRAEGKITPQDLGDAAVNLQSRTGFKWTRQDITALREMKAQKKTNAEIAQALGRTEDTVKQKWHQLQLKHSTKTASGQWKPGVIADEVEDRTKQAARTLGAAVKVKNSLWKMFGK